MSVSLTERTLKRVGDRLLDCMTLDRREEGLNKQNHKSLNERHFKGGKTAKKLVSDTNKEAGIDESLKSTERTMIRRGTIVEVDVSSKVDKGSIMKLLAIMGISQKHGNKWYHIRETDAQPYWPPEKKNETKKFRFHAREIVRDKKTAIAVFRPYDTMTDNRKNRKKKDKYYIQIDDMHDIFRLHGNITM